MKKILYVKIWWKSDLKKDDEKEEVHNSTVIQSQLYVTIIGPINPLFVCIEQYLTDNVWNWNIGLAFYVYMYTYTEMIKKQKVWKVLVEEQVKPSG